MISATATRFGTLSMSSRRLHALSKHWINTRVDVPITQSLDPFRVMLRVVIVGYLGLFTELYDMDCASNTAQVRQSMCEQ